TDPRSIRATRRLHAPFEPRGAKDLSLRRKLGQALKEIGAEFVRSEGGESEQRLSPKIVTRPARRGFFRPASKVHVLELLEAVGPVACYGLCTVEFVRRPHAGSTAVPIFGRYDVSGRILLFEQ